MKKTMSCIVSFLPLILLAVTFIFMCLLFFVEEGSALLMIIGLIGALIALAASTTGVVLMVIYMIKACKNPALSTGMKVLWCILLYCFNVFLFPVYWFMYIGKEM